MKPSQTTRRTRLSKRGLARLAALLFCCATATVAFAQSQKGEIFGYLLYDGERVPKDFNAGFSLYAAAWPLVETYPGHEFQSGLVGTWMHPQYEAGKKPEGKCYTDIEGDRKSVV